MKFGLAILSLTVVLLVADTSRAQSSFGAAELNRLKSTTSTAQFSTDRIRSNALNSALPRSGLGQFNTGVASNAFGRANKPFASISKGPSVTPYLALDNPFTSPATSYYTQIRPQLEQQRINQQQQKQNQYLQKQLAQFSSQRPYDPTGSENRAPTGHASVYMNYGGYYNVPAARR